MNAIPLAFYSNDTNTETILTTDASGNGYGAVLSQIQNNIERAIYFISRKITSNEEKYSASEQEALAVIWSVLKLHRFLYGRKFIIRTDHQCLRQLLTSMNGNGIAPCRISRWATKLLQYDYTVKYIKGKLNVVADCLSRIQEDKVEESWDHEVSITILTGGTLPVTLKELKDCIKEDEELSALHDKITTDNIIR